MNDDKLFKLSGAILIIIIGIAGIILVPITSAFVVSKFWAWFFTPVFFIKPPHLLNIIGLIVMFNFIRGTKPEVETEKKEPVWNYIKKLFTTVILKPGVVLLIGWFIHWLTT